MAGLTPEQRSLRARIAVHTSWSNTDDRTERTAKARAASPSSVEYWENQLDPDGTMPDDQRRRRAEAARSAHMSRLSLKASKSRAAKRGRRGGTSRSEKS